MAREIEAAGGAVETAVVDALDEQAAEKHADAVVRSAGGIDVSINAIRIVAQGAMGSPLIEMSPENFAHPFTAYTQANFLTARAAAWRMVEKRPGVILMLTAAPARNPLPLLGGMAPALAAIEALTRSFAAELGSQGSLRSEAIPETATMREAYSRRASVTSQTREQVQARAKSATLLQRLPSLVEVANVAAFLASDQASAMTATVANLSCGSLVE